MGILLSNKLMEATFIKAKHTIEKNITFLNDKPEETIDSTIRACWHTASGNPKSSEEAVKVSLPILTKSQINIFNSLIEKRVNNIPLAHLTGRKSFLGIEMLSDSRALIPRKETELLGFKALELSNELAQKKQFLKVMDICCGAGNLGLSIAHLNTKSIVYATDLSHDAISLTNDNIDFLNLRSRVQVLQGNLFSAFDHPSHYYNTSLIICNPPYISSSKVPKMDIEIANYEPSIAFDGGKFGTDIIQTFILSAPKYLEKNGWIVFEVGVGQGQFIIMLCERSKKYRDIQSVCDDKGNIRVILARAI